MNKKFLIPVARATAYDKNMKIIYDFRGFSNDEITKKQREFFEEFPEAEVNELHIWKIEDR